MGADLISELYELRELNFWIISFGYRVALDWRPMGQRCQIMKFRTEFLVAVNRQPLDGQCKPPVD